MPQASPTLSLSQPPERKTQNNHNLGMGTARSAANPPHLFFSFWIDKGNLHVGRRRERGRADRSVVLDQPFLRDAVAESNKPHCHNKEVP